ncbi:hypothetical protein ACIHFD_36150 [Nonomuraea sp. NPDC051941]
MRSSSRRALVAGYDRPSHRLRNWRPRIELDDLLQIFFEHAVEVEFR